GQVRGGLPHPALRGPYQLGNAAAAIMALDTLRARVPVASQAVRTGLLTAELPGRFQVLPGRPVTVLDVAHNPHGATQFAAGLAAMTDIARTHAVFAMLADKDIEGVVAAVKPHVDVWHLAPLPGPRGASIARLQAALDAAHVLDAVVEHASVVDAFAAARAAAKLDDRVVVFGSFHTVAPVLERLDAAPGGTA
nr:bifunctional folylpolyglutamate synthase/dihydrofolate synthase [Burkholderiales bacterium]